MASDGGAAGEFPHTVTLAFDIAVVLQDLLPAELRGASRQAASFRYTAPNGTRVTTEAVGRGGWEALKAPVASVTNADAAAAAPPSSAKGGAKPAPAAAAAGKAGGKPGDAAAAAGPPAGPALLRHRTVITLPADAAFCTRLAAFPLVAVVLATSPDPEPGSGGVPATPSGGKPPAAAAKGAPAASPAAAASSSSGSHPLVAFLPLDISPLLAGSQLVCGVYGDLQAAAGALKASGPPDPASPTSSPAAAEVDVAAALLGGGGGGAGVGASSTPLTLPSEPRLAPPALFSFLYVGVQILSATQSRLVDPAAAGAAAAAAAPAPAPAPAKGGKDDKKGGGKGAPAVDTGPPQPAMADVPILPPRLLSATLRRALNPLSLTVTAADGLPGYVVPDGSDKGLLRLVQPDAFELQRAHCRPTYMTLRVPEMKGVSGVASLAADGPGQLAASQDPSLVPRKYVVEAPGGATGGGGAGVVIAVPAPRSVCLLTPGVAPSSRHPARFTTVLCAGLVPLTPFREALRTSPLVVELHDRDCIPYEALQDAARTGNAAAELAASLKAAAAASAPKTTESAAPAAAPAPEPPKSAGKGAAKPSPAASAASAAAAPPGTAGAQPDAASAAADAAAAKAQQAADLGKFMAALLPKAWPWPLLPASRLVDYEGMVDGRVAWPAEAGGEAAAAAAATASASPPPTAGKGAAPSSPTKGAPGAAAGAGSGAPKRDIFDVDALLVSESLHRVARAGDAHSHGTAAFRLEGLLDRTGENRGVLKRRFGAAGHGGAVSADDDGEQSEEPIALKLSAGVSACNRRQRPKIPEPLYKLSVEQTAIIAPGAYGVTGARVKLVAEVAHPSALHTAPLTAADVTPFEPPFERLVIAFDYSNVELLHAVIAAVERVNAAALPHAPSTHTYELTEDEIAAADTAKLGVVTGVHIIDSHRRIMILEGLGGAGGGMAAIRAAVGPRAGLNTSSFRLLANPSVRFHTRLYARFHAAPKDIRLRGLLDDILNSPRLYDAQVVPASIREAFVALRLLLDADTLATAKENNAWPTAVSLLAVENKFGDTVSLADMYGEGHPAAHALEETRGRLTEALGLAAGQVDAATRGDLLLSLTLGRNRESAGDTMGMTGGLESTARRRTRLALKETLPVGTDVDYLLHLQATATARAKADFIAANVRAADAASDALAAKKQEELRATVGPEMAAKLGTLLPGQSLDTAGLAPPGGAVYPYSGQALNTGEWQRDLQRRRLAADHAATFTRGPEYGSLTVSLVDEKEEALRAAAASKAAWKTPRGFVYPGVRTKEEEWDNPHRPSASRNRELAEAWVDPEYTRAIAGAVAKAAETVPGKAVFRSNPQPQPLEPQRGYFGYTDPKDGTQRAQEFFATVHLTGVGLEVERKADEDRRKAEWDSKVVTGTTIWRGFDSHDGMAAVNRQHSLLRDPPKKYALKQLERVSLPSGKVVPLVNPPPSMDALLSPYVPPLNPVTSITKSLGGKGSESFLGRTGDGKPLDFRHVGPHDIVSGTAKSVHKPFLTAAQSPSAPVGGRPFVPSLVRGINTDRVEHAL